VIFFFGLDPSTLAFVQTAYFHLTLDILHRWKLDSWKVVSTIIDRTYQPVKILEDGFKDANVNFPLSWDGRNKSGEVVASGIYLLLFETEGKVNRLKIAVVK
jgi:hypothetical protein